MNGLYSGKPSLSDKSSTQSPFLYAVFAAVVILFIFCCGSIWRGLVLRHHRRSQGLPDLVTSPSGAVMEIPKTVPVMHEVSLQDWTMEKELDERTGSWRDIKVRITLSEVPRPEFS